MEALGLSCGSQVSQLGLEKLSECALKTVAIAQFRLRICACHFWQPNFAKDPRKIRERTAKDAMSQVHPSTWKAPCFWQFNLTLVCGIGLALYAITPAQGCRQFFSLSSPHAIVFLQQHAQRWQIMALMHARLAIQSDNVCGCTSRTHVPRCR